MWSLTSSWWGVRRGVILLLIFLMFSLSTPSWGMTKCTSKQIFQSLEGFLDLFHTLSVCKLWAKQQLQQQACIVFSRTVFLLCNRPTALCRKQSDSWLTRLKMYLNKAYYFILLYDYRKLAIKNVKRLASMKSIYCSNVWGQIKKTFIQQRSIKLSKSDSKDIYNVTNVCK